MPFDYGISSGLAYKHNFNEDIDRLYKDEYLIRQKKRQAEEDAKTLGNKLKFGNVSSPWHRRQLDAFTEKTLKDIGTIVDQNPNWQSNAMLWGQVNRLSDSLSNNWIVADDARHKTERDALLKFVHDNPNAYKLPEVQKQFDELKAYESYNGDGKPNDFIFRNPLSKYNLMEEAGKAAKYIQPSKINMKTVGDFGVPQYEYDPAEIETYVNVFENSVKNKLGLQRDFDALPEADKAKYGNAHNYGKSVFESMLPTQGEPRNLPKEEKGTGTRWNGNIGTSATGTYIINPEGLQRQEATPEQIDALTAQYNKSLKTIMEAGADRKTATSKLGTLDEYLKKQQQAQPQTTNPTVALQYKGATENPIRNFVDGKGKTISGSPNFFEFENGEWLLNVVQKEDGNSVSKRVPLLDNQGVNLDNIVADYGEIDLNKIDVGKGRQTVKTETSSAPKTQSEWNNEWAKLKKGESMVGLDGKTYKKQ